MTTRKFLLFLFINLTHHLCNGQINLLDSCGIDSNPILNQYEIKALDSLFFSPYSTKKSGTIDPKSGFNLNNKKIAFYSCTNNSMTRGNGLLSKKDFFSLCKPDFKGIAGRGIMTFNEQEKLKSNGYDAVIIICCPYENVKKEGLIKKLVAKSN